MSMFCTAEAVYTLLMYVMRKYISAQSLVEADWPCSLLDDVAMLHLANGHKPNLKQIRVHTNPVSTLGLQRLTKGRWPELCLLIIDVSTVCPVSLALLHVHTLSDWSQLSEWEVSGDPAQHEPGADVMWPNLSRCSFILGFDPLHSKLSLRLLRRRQFGQTL